METEIQQIKVSVIIPVYNVGNYLDRCLKSVLGQTEKNIEILCIDDCSTDDSLSILEGFGRKDKRLHIFKNEINQGQAYSRNIGLDNAQGKFIMFVDADDYIEHEMIEEMQNVMDAEDLELLFCNMWQDSSDRKDNNTVIKIYRRASYQSDRGFRLFQQMVQNHEMFGSVWGVMYKKEFLEKYSIRFMNGILHEDIPFIFRATLLSEKAGCVNRLYYHYVQRNSSTIHSGSLEKRLEGLVSAYFDMLSFWHEQKEKPAEINQSIHEYIEIYRKFILSLYNKINIEDMDDPVILYLNEIGFFGLGNSGRYAK